MSRSSAPLPGETGGSGQVRRPVWTEPGMPALMLMVTSGFAGFALLFPTVPLWAVQGGSGTAGAGLVNAVLMLFTVVAQTLVPSAIRRFGWAPTLILGMTLLGAPALAHIWVTGLPGLLVLSALRGLGFGVITVCGSSAVAELTEPARRGRAIGAYGLAIAAPQFLLVSTSSWIAEQLGFALVFVVAACPLLGIVPAVALARRLHDADRSTHPTHLGQRRVEALRRLLRPMLLLLAATAAGGALITFTPQMSTVPGATIAGLLLLTGGAAVCRWLVGGLVDRRGTRPFLAPLTMLTAVGLGLTAWAVRDPDATAVLPLLAGMALVGAAYGALQNLTLVEAFAVVERRFRDDASAVWNIGFDAGTGLGALLVGHLAAGHSFPVAFLVVAGFSVVVLPLSVLRVRHAAVPPPVDQAPLT